MANPAEQIQSIWPYRDRHAPIPLIRPRRDSVARRGIGLRAATQFPVLVCEGPHIAHCRAVELSVTGMVVDRGRELSDREMRAHFKLELMLPEQRFPAASYDAVTMSHSIEHVHDPVGWLAEARRVLRPRGRLALATPNAHSLLHRRFGRHWFPLEPPRHLHLFNRRALASALRKAGFGRFRVFTSARDAVGVFLASRAIRSRGRFDVLARATRSQRLCARAVQLQEAVLLRLDPDAGEDLVAIVER